MAAIHKALGGCSAEYPVFYEDGVDIHLNQKIGADWQFSGQQNRVVTPGQNENTILLEPCSGLAIRPGYRPRWLGDKQTKRQGQTDPADSSASAQPVSNIVQVRAVSP